MILSGHGAPIEDKGQSFVLEVGISLMARHLVSLQFTWHTAYTIVASSLEQLLQRDVWHYLEDRFEDAWNHA